MHATQAEQAKKILNGILQNIKVLGNISYNTFFVELSN